MFLSVHSQYSLRYGTLSIAQIIDLALAHGVQSLVLTDINNSTGCMEFIRACRERNGTLANEQQLNPLIGIDFRDDYNFLYLGIAKNKEGMKELNEFLTLHNLEKKPFPAVPPSLNNAYWIFPFKNYPSSLPDHAFVGIRKEELNFLRKLDLQFLKNKLVIYHPITISDKKTHRVHQYLRAIEESTLLTKIDPHKTCKPTEVFTTIETLKNQFAQYPFIIENTHQLLQNCTTSMYDFGHKNKKTFTGTKSDDIAFLKKLALDGLVYRYGRKNNVAHERLLKELKVIDELNFCAYFLITWDIIRYSMSRGYYHVGRGSGANSIVAYCLKITDVDPIELDLYFERFLNHKRTSPPDFDIDYSWDEREDVQDYIFKRYGRNHTALLGTMSTFKDRSIIREIGKVMGLPASEIESYTDPTLNLNHQDQSALNKIKAIYTYINGFPNQRSIHAGGVLISEEPITYYTALDLPPKGMPTVQWDMYEAEAIGLDKFDILSQRGIGHIREAVNWVSLNKGITIDIHNFAAFKNDKTVNERLKLADAIGCFYIESPAMRQLLAKLNCENYLTLVAASSIIRPGVASSGMMKSYIQNYHNPKSIKYLHPIIEEQLKETYGIMVYQEDVIKICHHFAGLDHADADILRRGMSGKYRSKVEFDKLKDRFFEGAKQLNRDLATTLEVWRQVSSFAGYSFSKAHSASFAVESYQSLYLKTYYPMEFMVAVINNYGGFYSRWLYVHELQKTGADVHLPCVNHSDTKVIISGKTVYLGWERIAGLETKWAELIPHERKLNGIFTSLEDFLKRTAITLEQCILLIRIGALRFTKQSKKELLWNVHLLLGTKTKPSNTSTLFNEPTPQFQLPDLETTLLEDAYQELELLGFSHSLTPFELLQTKYRGMAFAKDLKNYVGKTVKMVGNYVCEKTVYTKTNTKMWFGTFLDVNGDFFDTIHFPNSTPNYPFRGMGCYLIYGRVIDDFKVYGIEVLRFEKLPFKKNPILP